MTTTPDYPTEVIEFAEALKTEADGDGVLRIGPFGGSLEEIYAATGLPAGRRPTVIHTLKRDGFLIEETPSDDPFATRYRLIGVPDAPGPPDDVTPDVSVDLPKQRPGEAAEGRDSDNSHSPEKDPPCPPATSEPKRKRGRPKGSTVPKPKVPTRPPRTQNEHHFAILNHRDLNAFEQHIGFVAHIKIGSELHGQFGDPGKGVELAAANIAREAKRANSQSKVGEAMRKLVEVGLFRRLDNGQGNSKARGNKATYVPVVPEFSR